MGKIVLKLSLLFAAALTVASCNTEDIHLNTDGISTNLARVMVPNEPSSVSYLTVSSFHPWHVDFENEADRSWLSLSVEEGPATTEISLTGQENPYRRRSAALIFSNDYKTYRVIAIQHAAEDYEPGTVIYTESFGTEAVEELTPVDDFSGWSARGTGVSLRNYTGIDAYVATQVSSSDYAGQPHEVMSGGNALKIEPGGVLNVPRLNKANADHVFLTLYAASWDGNYLPMQQDGIYIEGGTEGHSDNAAFNRLPLSVTTLSGWQKIEVQFRIIESSSNFYLRIGNAGTRDIYIDDITLETGGRGSQVVGNPTPTVTTLAADAVDRHVATLRGSYTVPDGVTVTSAGFEWKSSEDADYAKVEIGGTAPEVEFSHQLTALEAGTEYTYRAYTVHGDDIVTYASDITFTTLSND